MRTLAGIWQFVREKPSRWIKLLILVALLCFGLLSGRFQLEAQTMVPHITSEDALSDLAFLERMVMRHHPNLGLYKPKSSFIEQVSALKTRVAIQDSEVDRSEFARDLATILASVGDGHSCIFPREAHFPLNLRLVEGKIYLDAEIRDLASPVEVMDINEQPGDDWLEKLSRLTCVEGGEAQAALKIAAQQFSLFSPLMNKGDETVRFRVLDRDGVEHRIRVKGFRVWKGGNRHGMLKLNQNPFETLIEHRLVAPGLMYLRVPSFHLDHDSFESQLDNFFEVLIENKAQDLILDVRGNAGGLIKNASLALAFFIHRRHHFPKYLHVNKTRFASKDMAYWVGAGHHDKKVGDRLRKKVNKEIRLYSRHGTARSAQPSGRRVPTRSVAWGKKSFRGRIHLLIDETTASAAAIFASHLRRYRDVTIYGTRLSGSSGRGCMRSGLDFLLPNADVTMSLAWLCFMLDNKALTLAEARKPFVPDFLIEQKLEDHLRGKDTLIERVKDRVAAYDKPPKPSFRPDVPAWFLERETKP